MLNYCTERLLLGCVYRPPFYDPVCAAEINAAIAGANQLASSKICSGMLVVGDFNFGNITWSGDGHVLEASSSDSLMDELVRIFIDVLNDAYLFQAVNEPTFQTAPEQFSGILDLVITESVEPI